MSRRAVDSPTGVSIRGTSLRGTPLHSHTRSQTQSILFLGVAQGGLMPYAIWRRWLNVCPGLSPRFNVMQIIGLKGSLLTHVVKVLVGVALFESMVLYAFSGQWMGISPMITSMKFTHENVPFKQSVVDYII